MSATRLRTFLVRTSFFGASFAGASFGGVVAAEAPPVAQLKKCVEEGQACSQAVVSGDDKKVVACTYPTLVKLVGGAYAMKDLLRNGREQMKAQSIELVGVTVYPPSELVQGSSEVYAILKSHLVMKRPEGTMHQSSFLVGVSGDKGKSWRFVDGAGLDEDKVKSVLPKLPSQMKLPPREEPTLEP